MAGNQQWITVRPRGPYLVRGNIPLVRMNQVMTEYGEPIDWKMEGTFQSSETYRLCRSGRSKIKPFCDGTHTMVDFDGTETADTGPISSREKEFEGEKVLVKDDHSLCVHAGYCGNRLTNVWELVKQSGDTQVLSQIIQMVEMCPSGTLSYVPDGGTESAELHLPKEVAVISNGPLWVRGGIRVVRRDGKPLETRNRVTLCRCGASANKPFCDGSHKDIGFSDAMSVPDLAEASSSSDPDVVRILVPGGSIDQDFTKAALTTDLAPGEKKLVHIGKEWILLANVEGEYRAVEGRCTHANVVLSRGQLDGEEVTCPLHKSVFNVRTGEVIAPPASRALKVFTVRVDGEQVLIGPPEIGDD